MKIFIAGDFCPYDRVATMVANKDFSFFDGVKDLIKEADYSIVNFECPVVEGDAKPIAKCGPALRTERAAVAAMKYAGFNCATLANNHFRDFGDSGCLTTLEELEAQDMDYVGGGKTLAEAQKVLYKEIQGKKVAIVNFCENEFSIATATTAGAAPLDSVDNYHQITEARRNADFVLVIVHGGHEHYQLPSPRMKKLYRFFVEIGADAVVNHHQHCYSGYEYYNGKPIVYGLGNFCFDWKGKNASIWNEGYCVEIDTNNLEIRLIPYRQCEQVAKVLPMDENNATTFSQHIAELNAIIANDESLQFEFNKWVERSAKYKMITFAPYFHRYLNAAADRGWIPMKLNAKRAGVLLNHISCEAHRDITISVLNSRMYHNRE